MKTQTEKETTTKTETFVKIAVDAWRAQNEKVDKFLAEISDENLKAEIAPGKNSGVYLVGHLAAVNDNLLQILGLGERLHPQLEEIFLKNPENKDAETVSIDELKKNWKEINSTLSEHFAKLSADEWFAKHASVSDEDFAKEPHRNRLNVLLSRTIHQSNHLGQLSILAKR
jgi:uncharacterized damage-inducible protein DinB